MRHTHRLLCKHILAIREIPTFAHTIAVCIFESNLAFESQHLLHALEAAGIKRWCSLSEGQQGSLGFLTTNERKEQMALLLREALTVGKIAFHDKFLSVELNAPEAKKALIDEMLNVCNIIRTHTQTTFTPPLCFCAVLRRHRSGQDNLWQGALLVLPRRTLATKEGLHKRHSDAHQ